MDHSKNKPLLGDAVRAKMILSSVHVDSGLTCSAAVNEKTPDKKLVSAQEFFGSSSSSKPKVMKKMKYVPTHY